MSEVIVVPDPAETEEAREMAEAAAAATEVLAEQVAEVREELADAKDDPGVTRAEFDALAAQLARLTAALEATEAPPAVVEVEPAPEPAQSPDPAPTPQEPEPDEFVTPEPVAKDKPKKKVEGSAEPAKPSRRFGSDSWYGSRR